MDPRLSRVPGNRGMKTLGYECEWLGKSWVSTVLASTRAFD